jgi:hypothetical protein
MPDGEGAQSMEHNQIFGPAPKIFEWDEVRSGSSPIVRLWAGRTR